MLVSFRHNFIFLANPRCGSSSIRRALDSFADLRTSRKGLHPHTCLASIERHLRAEGQANDLSRFLIFTTCRNPWERVVSIYHFGLTRPRSIWHRPAVDSGSFVAFCQADILDVIFRPKPGEPVSSEGPFDVVSFGSDLAGTFRAEVFDLSEIGALVSRLAAQGVDVEMPHVQRSEHGDYRSYYDDVTRARVAYLFERDIDLMGYTFDGYRLWTRH